MESITADAVAHRAKLTAKRLTLLKNVLAYRDHTAEPVVKAVNLGDTAEPNPITGRYPTTVEGNTGTVEYEPDPDLRDTEQIPLLEDGGIEAYLQREVLPYAEDAWYAPSSVKTGYEINFNGHFYKPQSDATVGRDTWPTFSPLEQESEGLLAEIIEMTDGPAWRI